MKRASSAVTAGSSAVSRVSSLAMRKAESAGAPGRCNMLSALFLVRRGRRIQGDRELRDIGPALQRGNLAHTLLLHFIDAQYGVQGQVGALDTLEFALYALLGRIHHHRGALAEHQLLHLDEPEQLSVADASGINLINLALIHEHNAENVTDCHGLEWGSLLI